MHQMDGRTTFFFCLESIGRRYAVRFPHGVPSAGPLFLKIEEFQQGWLIGGHRINNPSYQYERFQCGISNADMSLFDEYSELFVELQTADQPPSDPRSIVLWFIGPR